jgi:hypothetical protein
MLLVKSNIWFCFHNYEFSINPSRDATSDPRDPDLIRDLRLGTAGLEGISVRNQTE